MAPVMAPVMANSKAESPEYNVLIVGAGFAGIFLLHSLRKQGLKCKVYEAGTDLGGIWHWNSYPGARVDSESVVYQLSIPEVAKSWTFSERFPNREELLAYFAHMEKILDIKKDVEFNKRVVGAQFDREKSHKWEVETEDGQVTTCRFLLVCVGLASKRYVPDFRGLESFQGNIYHSSSWPQDGVDVKGKKVAVIGTGSTGVQIIQEWAKEAGHVTVFQRTPNFAIPMRQQKYTDEERKELQSQCEPFFEERIITRTGMLASSDPRKTFDVSQEEREALYESLCEKGGFHIVLSNFIDLLLDPKANKETYDFWAKKTRTRILDERKRDLLAPLEQPHAFGAKRASLEQDYFEQYNRPNVDLVSIRGNPILEIKPTGIQTSDGSFYPVDVIAFATGFDAITGGMMNMGLRNTEGVSLADEWKDGTRTYLGLARRGYPNMFFTYGTHAPTALSNGPSSIEIQGRWIVDAISKIISTGLSYIEPTADAETAWKAQITQITDMTLLPQVDSWWMGANIPGKKREMLNYPGGLPAYTSQCTHALETWEGFVTSR